MLHGGERMGTREFEAHDVRLGDRFAPFAALKELKDVIVEVEEGVEV